jgi:hypothetical protein
VQVPYQANQSRLIGIDCKQRGCRIHPYHRHLQRAYGIEVVLIYLASYLDLVGTDIVHAGFPFWQNHLSNDPILPKNKAAQIT